MSSYLLYFFYPSTVYMEIQYTIACFIHAILSRQWFEIA